MRSLLGDQGVAAARIGAVTVVLLSFTIVRGFVACPIAESSHWSPSGCEIGRPEAVDALVGVATTTPGAGPSVVELVGVAPVTQLDRSYWGGWCPGTHSTSTWPKAAVPVVTNLLRCSQQFGRAAGSRSSKFEAVVGGQGAAVEPVGLEPPCGHAYLSAFASHHIGQQPGSWIA